MATIVQTLMRGLGHRTVTETTLGTSNALTYAPGNGQVLILRNPTGAGIASVIDGAGATTKGVAGIGTIDLSGGYNVGTIPAGGSIAIPLDTIKDFLDGAINVTGSGLVASLLAN